MNLNSIWTSLEESFDMFDEIVGTAVMGFVKEKNLPSGWGTWGPAIVLFPDEIISTTQYMRIFPYGLARTIGERFESAAQRGFLVSEEQGYRATEQGKSINQQGLNALTNSIAHIDPISSTEFQRLIDYLVRLVEASISASEPPPKFCIAHYMNYKSTFSSETSLSRIFVHHFKELDFYRMDSHMAAWQIHNIEGNLWEVFSEVWGGENNTLDKLYEELSFRGITRDEYTQILQELVKYDWIQETDGEYRITPKGKHIREEAEVLTNRYFFTPWSCLSESELEDFMNLAIQLRDGLSGLKEK